MKINRNQLQATARGTTGFTRRKVLNLALTVTVLSVTMGFTAPRAQAQRAQLKVFGETKYVNGVNVPWFTNGGGSDYAHDLGYNYVTGYRASFDQEQVRRDLRNIRSMNCNVARLFIFEGMEGLKLDSGGKVSGLDNNFKANLNTVLYLATQEKVAIQLCLLNHDIKAQFNSTVRSDGSTVTGGARIRNFLEDSSAQQAFLDKAVAPLVRDCLKWSSGGVKSSVFGIDVMNEPYWGVTGEPTYVPTFSTWPQMHAFVYNVARKIHDIDASIPVGIDGRAEDFNKNNHWQRFGGIGLDYYAFHDYSATPNIPNFTDRNIYAVDKPMLLGEFNTTNSGNPSFDAQGRAIDTYIQQARDRGYAGAVVWSYSPSGAPDLGITNSDGSWRIGAGKMRYWGKEFGIGNN